MLLKFNLRFSYKQPDTYGKVIINAGEYKELEDPKVIEAALAGYAEEMVVAAPKAKRKPRSDKGVKRPSVEGADVSVDVQNSPITNGIDL
jgi:hypothetical protein